MVVDSGVLYLVSGFAGLYLGRLLSFCCAVLTTWLLNRNFTFGNRRSELTLRRELSHYFGAMVFGGVANYGVYAALVARSPFFAAWPVLAVGLGSLAGLAINFTLARWFIFRNPADTTKVEPHPPRD